VHDTHTLCSSTILTLQTDFCPSRVKGRAAPDAHRQQGSVRGGRVRAQGRRPWPRGAARRHATLRRHRSGKPHQVLPRMRALLKRLSKSCVYSVQNDAFL
jgi:hypothetical protein